MTIGKLFACAEQVALPLFLKINMKNAFHRISFFAYKTPKNDYNFHNLNIIVGRKDEKTRILIEFEPYFVKSYCFLQSLKSLFGKKL